MIAAQSGLEPVILHVGSLSNNLRLDLLPYAYMPLTIIMHDAHLGLALDIIFYKIELDIYLQFF